MTLNILYVDFSDSVGGGQKRIIAHVKGLDGIVDANFCVGLLRRNREFERLLKKEKITYFHINEKLDSASKLHKIKILLTSRLNVPDKKYDIVCSFGFYCALWVSFSCIRGTHVHYVLSSFNNLKNIIYFLFIKRKVSALAVNSRFTLATISTRNTSKIPFEIVYSAVGVDSNYRAEKLPKNILSNASGKRKTILYVGRINPRKRLEDFLSMAEILNSRQCNYRYLIVGAPSRDISIDYSKKIFERAVSIAGVEVLGHRDDVREIMKCADCMVLPSINEPYGRVIIEALADRVPVIATKPGGPEEIFEEFGEIKPGVLVESCCPKAIAEAVEAILECPSKFSYSHFPSVFTDGHILQNEAAFLLRLKQ